MKETQNLIKTIDAEGLWRKDLVLKRNEYLKVAGSVNRNLYFIKSGSLRIFVVEEEEEKTIRFGYKNNLIAALDSFITGAPSEYYIQAIKKTELKIIGRASLDEMIANSASLQRDWNTILEYIILQTLERERDILTTSPQERYQRVFHRSPQLFQEIPSKYIASYLRMSPETLSRIKKS